MGAYSAFNSFSKGEAFSGFIDLSATAVGIGVGAAALIAISTPVWAPIAIGVGAFGLATVATVGIDWGANKIKDNIYGR